MANTPAKNSSPKKSRTTTPAPVTPPADPAPQPSIISEKEQPAAPTVSLSEQNSNGVTLGEEQTEGATPKKKKKKKKEANENKDKEEETKKGSETIGQVSCEKPLEETKKATAGRKQNEYREDVVTEDQTVTAQYDEVPDSVVLEQKKEKKARKKKKEKIEQEEEQVNSEQISEKVNDGTEEIMPAKKKKKKKSKTDIENSEATDKESEIIPAGNPSDNSNLADKERKTKRERDKSDFQDPSEQILKKKKRKKDKADREETAPEQVDKDKHDIADVNSNTPSEFPLENDSAPLPQLIPETPQTEKKKSE